MVKHKLEFTETELDRSSFSKRLRIALSASDYKSGNALAADIGCSQQSVHSWLKSAAEPGRDRLVALAIKLGVTLNWLAAGESISLRDAQLQLELDKDELFKLKKLEKEASSIEDLKEIKERIQSMHNYLSISEESITLLKRLESKKDKSTARIRKNALGEDRSDFTPGPSSIDQRQSVDQTLMGRCTDAYGKLYKEMGITLSMSDLGSLAAQAYNDLAAAGAEDMDIPTQLAMIRSLVERHRREILAEATANRQGKLSAS